MPIPNTILNIPGRSSASTVELIFVAENVPPLGFLSFYVSTTAGNKVMKPKRLRSLSYQVNYTPNEKQIFIKGVKITVANRHRPRYGKSE